MRYNVLNIAGLALALSGFSTGSLADAGVATKNVDQLLAMPKAERNRYLKGLEQSQRRGLWYELKKAEKAAQGITPGSKGSSAPRAVSIDRRSVFNRSAPNNKVGKAIGTIAYDSGSPTVSYGSYGGSGNRLIGNRFDTHTSMPVVASGTISTVQAVVVPGPSVTTNSAGFVINGALNTTNNQYPAIFSTFTSVAGGSATTVTFAGLGVNYTDSEFFVVFGDFAASYIPVLGTGTTLGQGYHGVQGLTGGFGPNMASMVNETNLNAFVRVTGNIVPVELMSFGVE